MTNSPSYEALFAEIEKTAKLVRRLSNGRNGFIVTQRFSEEMQKMNETLEHVKVEMQDLSPTAPDHEFTFPIEDEV